ncbi:hypothetical protein E3N88_27480 [Mikania micrantha]|uniref:Dynamin stalk domain-containing protein n=1 Tax=Mikania micrantha TaxID=192012 RepID=A0A5N6MWS6_9ASTR|nr:hypothetical protein E3N88_27480 [Mikania micrantha]
MFEKLYDERLIKVEGDLKDMQVTERVVVSGKLAKSKGIGAIGKAIPQFLPPYNPATLAETNTKNATMAENGVQKTEVIHPSADDHDQKSTPLVASYNDKIRPILDAVDKLRRLNVTQEGIPLPTIVVLLQHIQRTSRRQIGERTQTHCRLVAIQSVIISKCLPNIVKKINERLHASVLDFNKLPRNLTSVSEAMGAFVQIVGSFKETLQKILIRSELDEYEDDKQMHCNARLAEMLDKLSQDLQSSVNCSKNFLVEEMQILEEANGIRLPHFLPHLVFSSLLKRRVNGVSDMPICFVNKVCGQNLEGTNCQFRILLSSSTHHPLEPDANRLLTNNPTEHA